MKLTLTGAALLIALPSFAFAQTTGPSMSAQPSTSVPSAQQDKTPAANTPDPNNRSGRSTGVSPAAPLGAAGEMSEHPSPRNDMR